MKSISSISSDIVRKNWNMYSYCGVNDNDTENENQIDYFYFDIIWNCWAEKFDIDINEKKSIILKSFILNEYENILQTEGLFLSNIQKPFDISTETKKICIINNENILIMLELNEEERLSFHFICSKLGLFHKNMKCQNQLQLQNVMVKKHTDKEWRWEYTNTSTYVDKEFYFLKNKEKEKEKDYDSYYDDSFILRRKTISKRSKSF